MVINNLNNVLVNTFIKGMNSDTSFDKISSDLYAYALNLRQTVINSEKISNIKQGAIGPVLEWIVKLSVVSLDETVNIVSVMSVDIVQNIGAVVVKVKEKEGDKDVFHWSVIRMEIKDDSIQLSHLYTSKSKLDENKNKFSTTIYYNNDESILLYIATGNLPITVINLQEKLSWFSSITSDHILSHGAVFPSHKPKCKTVNGNLYASLVQYAYKLYRKYSLVSKMSPLTNKIQLGSVERGELGLAEGTNTGRGICVTVDDLIIPNSTNTLYDIFDRIIIYRIQYIKAQQLPEVHIVYDGDFIEMQNWRFYDTEQQSLQQLSVEEFIDSNLFIVPQTIEQFSNRLFQANCSEHMAPVHKLKNLNTTAYSFKPNGTATFYRTNAYESSDSITIDNFNVGDTRLSEYFINEFQDINYIIPVTNKNEKGLFTVKNMLTFYDGEIYGGRGPVVSWKLVARRRNKELLSYVGVSDLNGHELRLYPTGKTTTLYIEDNCVFLADDEGLSYKDLTISSMCRSLARGETYRYGIVFYDIYGNRSDAKWIADIKTPTCSMLPVSFSQSYSLGVLFEVNLPKEYKNDIVGYEIVRCEKNTDTTKFPLTGVLSTPVRLMLEKDGSKYSPLYPTGMISTQWLRYVVGKDSNLVTPENPVGVGLYTVTSNYDIDIKIEAIDLDFKNDRSVVLFFCPEMQVLRKTTVSKLKGRHSLIPLLAISTRKDDNPWWFYSSDSSPYEWRIVKNIMAPDKGAKLTQTVVLDYVEPINTMLGTYDRFGDELYDIIDLCDVKTADWNSGFGNVTRYGEIFEGTLAYKQFMSSVDTKSYMNWVCSTLYDVSVDNIYNKIKLKYDRKIFAEGLLGPGPLCLLLAVKLKQDGENKYPFILDTDYRDQGKYENPLITTYAAIAKEHARQFAGHLKQDHLLDMYYGHGFYISLDKNKTVLQNIVFDGDKYIIPCEFVSMYKAYDFQALDDSLLSTLIVNYVTMETSINQLLDYGCNYRNTLNPNIQVEPNAISGVSSQPRPEHLYNPIYSDNETSISAYAAESLLYDTLKYPSRIYYSEKKAGGELFDLYANVLPAQFIDADVRYGQITNLKCSNQNIYFWLNSAFGKLTVDEKVALGGESQLILGQTGVINRVDYLSTSYGMEEDQYCSVSVDNTIAWIDTIAGAALLYSSQDSTKSAGVIDMGKQCQVQTCIKNRKRTGVPLCTFDDHFGELIYDFLLNNEHQAQLIAKINPLHCTGIYTRSVQEYLRTQKGLLYFDVSADGELIIKTSNFGEKYNILCPTQLVFIVNSSNSVKTFDNQLIVIAKHSDIEHDTFVDNFFTNKIFDFTTDIANGTILKNSKKLSNREGKIEYAIPRKGGAEFGDRLRGKWLCVDMLDEDPSDQYSITSVISTFRKSW